MYTPSKELKDFVQSLPKTETHLHLEGACPFEMIQKAAPGRFKGEPPMWDDSFRYDSFYQFMELYSEFCEAVFTSADAYHEAAKVILKNCADQNCRYVETSFHVGALLGGAMTGPQLIEAVLAAAPEDLEVRVYMGMCHNDYTDLCKEIIDDSINWDQLTGIDLHGPEDWPLEPWTADVWKTAAAHGKKLKAHAGEFMPASFVKRCVEELDVRRIQHGVRSIEDPEVVALLKTQDATLDICPISNLKLQVKGVTTMSVHPIRQLFDQGVRCTISSDDRFMFGNTLSEEYYALKTDLAFTDVELIQIARNGFAVSDWNGPGKAAALEELAAIEEKL